MIKKLGVLIKENTTSVIIITLGFFLSLKIKDLADNLFSFLNEIGFGYF